MNLHFPQLPCQTLVLTLKSLQFEALLGKLRLEACHLAILRSESCEEACFFQLRVPQCVFQNAQLLALVDHIPNVAHRLLVKSCRDLGDGAAWSPRAVMGPAHAPRRRN